MVKTKLSIFCEKFIEAGWLAALIVVPLYFNIYSARTFEPDKITFLRAIVSLMVLAWIVMMVEQGHSSPGDSPVLSRDRFRSWLKMPLFLPTALLVLAYIVSTIFSISPAVSFWGSYQRMQGTYSFLTYVVLFALVAGNLRSREQVDRLVTTVIVASIPISLYGIIQKYGLDPLPWAGDVTTRVASSLGNAIFVASYLIMAIPLTISRLIESMIAIIKEEKASWGHTILAAIYIFALAVQTLTVIFSQSRGPMLGILAASFVMGLLLILTLRRLHSDPTPLSIKEFAQGLGFIIPLGLAGGLLGGIGYVLGTVSQGMLLASGYQVDNVALLGAVLGGILGFVGLYTYMAASGRGWRWLWVSWIGIGAFSIAFVITLNITVPALDAYLSPIRELPYVNRLSNVIETTGSGKVRILIWEAAMELIKFHKPLGVEGDNESKPDSFNAIRPLVGYGPESMFNAFAFVYPPELAHVENRGSSADRSHNETMDSLVITGLLGFLAFYFLMISVFYYMLTWLGWAPDGAAKKRLIGLLIGCGLVGGIIAYLADGTLTYIPLGLPFGLITGVILHLFVQGLVSQDKGLASTEMISEDKGQLGPYTLLLIGVLGAIVGHFIEVHFVFSIGATYTYFWAYAGLMVALARISKAESSAEPVEVARQEALAAATPAESQAVSTPRRGRKGRNRRGGAAPSARPNVLVYGTGRESWETWVGSQGLVMAIILIILTFDFITPQFAFSLSNEKSASLFWMMSITWGIGIAVALSNLAVQGEKWSGRIKWGSAALLYIITSLSYFFFYLLAHRNEFQPVTVTGLADVIEAANVLTRALVVFDLALLLLMIILTITLSLRQMQNRVFWRAENWWLYPPLMVAVLAIIWYKNIDVVRADIYLKEGERYRNNGQWNEAIALHEKARLLDSDEDFYYLMLALDYQLMAQDAKLAAEQRQVAWKEGERIALEAREINPYNPDNTGNMGRYYFTLGQLFSRERFQDALAFFEKAAELAPSNVIYHNLWAQTYYILQDYESAIDRLQTSISIDPDYSPSWLLLGDTYAAMGKIDEALQAHKEAIKINSTGGGDGFAAFDDQFLDQRLNFYLSAGRINDIIATMEQVALERPDDPLIPQAIGRAYSLAGQQDKAALYFEQARKLGDQSPTTLKSLADLYLASKSYDQAIPVYESLLETNPNDVEAHSALAYIFAQQGRVDDAIMHNQQVLQQLPQDYDSLKNMAILYQQKGQLPEALDFAKKAQAAASDTERPSWDQLITTLENQIAANK